MRHPKAFAFALLLLVVGTASVQSQTPDLADQAIISAFQRHKGSLLCVSKAGSLKEVRDLLNPYIAGIALSDNNSYPALTLAIYQAFPCPFNPDRSELRPATKEDLIGDWLFPDASMKLRHGPASRAGAATPGLPPLKCEGISFSASGVYRVIQIRGQLECPNLDGFQLAGKLPAVSTWSPVRNNRVKISRSDVPSHFEEWDIFVVETAFDQFGVRFNSGDLLSYQRKEPGNEIGAATVFRHLQRAR